MILISLIKWKNDENKGANLDFNNVIDENDRMVIIGLMDFQSPDINESGDINGGDISKFIPYMNEVGLKC